LQKLEAARTQAILIVPNWPTQPWYPLLMRLLIQQQIFLPKGKSNVTLPFKQEKGHPLGKQLKLMACLLSGDPCQVRHFTKSSDNNTQLLAIWHTETIPSFSQQIAIIC
jgi:hypothetical protein